MSAVVAIKKENRIVIGADQSIWCETETLSNTFPKVAVIRSMSMVVTGSSDHTGQLMALFRGVKDMCKDCKNPSQVIKATSSSWENGEIEGIEVDPNGNTSSQLIVAAQTSWLGYCVAQSTMEGISSLLVIHLTL